MKHLAACTDPEYTAVENPSRLDSFFLKYIQDKRDLPFAYLTLKISVTLLPLAVLLFVPALTGWLWWAVLAVYMGLSNARFRGPYGLMQHCTSHRVFFRKKYGYLNHYLPWVIGPLFGQTPETYFTHHLGMHHPENNLPDDESSTMFFQRDSLRSFLHYLGDFFVRGLPNLARYLHSRNKLTLRHRLMRGELVYLVVTFGLCFVNLPATLAVFVFPVIMGRVVMMLGNWSQHAFIAAETPDNCYTNSVTCINTNYNHKCWNDGYHISHHLKPAMHWTEHPGHFRQNLAQYAQNEAIVFDGIHFLHIFAYLMTKRYDLLAKNFVSLDGRYADDAAVIALLKSRTRRIRRPVQLAQAA
ncbi:fatty acid desaturase [Hymenobacter algoricola]